MALLPPSKPPVDLRHIIPMVRPGNLQQKRPDEHNRQHVSPYPQVHLYKPQQRNPPYFYLFLQRPLTPDNRLVGKTSDPILLADGRCRDQGCVPLCVGDGAGVQQIYPR